MLTRIVAYIQKMLGDGLGDADFTNGDSQHLHQLQGIVIGTVGSAESRHGNTNDAATLQPQLVEGLYGDEQRQGGVKSATDTDNGLGAADMVEALGEA